MARPFLFALRREGAGARITAWGPAAVLGLLAGDACWDEARPWPDAAPAPGLDAMFVLPPSFSSAWHALRTGARERVGFCGDARDLLLTRAVRRPDRGERHLASEYLSLLGPVAGPPPAPPALHVDEAARLEGDALLASEAAGERPIALLAPGAIYGPAKRWPVERFALLARELAAQGHAVYACGGREDHEACGALIAAAGMLPGGRVAARGLVGRTTLPVQVAIAARAAVVVSNDSGFAHLAAAAGAPTVAIFGSTSSAWTAPLGPRVAILQRPPVCSPCFHRTCAIGYDCLKAVSVADVLGAVAALATSAREGVA